MISKLTAWITAFAILTAPIPAAMARSAYTPEEMDAVFTAYFKHYQLPEAGQDPDDYDNADRTEEPKRIARMLGDQGIADHNESLYLLLSHYKTSPADREAIILLTTAWRDRITDELKDIRERSMLLDTIRYAFYASMAVNAFCFGRGIWKSRGQGLKMVERWGAGMKAVPVSLGSRVLIETATFQVGVLGAAYQQLAKAKLDPVAELHALQTKMVKELKLTLVAIRERLKGVRIEARNQSLTVARREAIRKEVADLDPVLSSISDEKDHLAKANEDLAEPLLAAGTNLDVVRALYSQVRMGLDMQEIRNAFQAPADDEAGETDDEPAPVKP